MITRSLSRLREEATGRSPARGRGARASSPAQAGPGARVRPSTRTGASGGGNAADNYWSSTSYVNNPDNAWDVNFDDGNVNANNKSNNTIVRAVRGGS
jgi:hypothetical protein